LSVEWILGFGTDFRFLSHWLTD